MMCNNLGNHLKSGSSHSNTIILNKSANLDSRYQNCRTDQLFATIIRKISSPVGFLGAAIVVFLIEVLIPRACASTLFVCECTGDVHVN
jgi:hypothetical protein